MDITLVVYVSQDSNYLAQLLAEIFEQSEHFKLELIAVDGGTTRVDFEKLNKHCSDHGIEFSTVRQDPMNRIAPGFNVAARQARGRTLAFVNQAIHIPHDFLDIVDYLGSHKKVVIPRAWMNVAAGTSECWGFWTPPDGCSLIMPQEYYSDDLLGEVVWERSAWPKTDAYFLASRLSASHGKHVGMATVADYEYRRWMSSTQAEAYMEVVEHNLVDIHAWVLNERDIRRYTTLNVPFDTVTESIPQFRSSDDMEQTIRKIVGNLQKKHQILGDPLKIAPAMQKDLDEILDSLFHEGQMVLRPRFFVEPLVEKNMVRVRSAGDVLLPHEMPV